MQARERLPLATIRSIVSDLSETTDRATNFIVHETEYSIYTFCIEPSDDDYLPFTEGDIAPLHATAGGKAILAYLPAERRRELIEPRGLTEYTDRTITDWAELEKELRSVRNQRIAFDREEFIEGYQCVASPVMGEGRVPLGAVSVTGNIDRMSGKRLDEDVTGLVTSAAKSIENDILTS
jgi:DNA-binding IclR family transcriptional regulator